jgi:hypothetical protein
VSKDSKASSTKFARTQTAAFSATDATVLPWAPKITGGNVKAMVISPDASKIVLGGKFRSLNGSTMPGTLIGAVDTNTGTTALPWGMNTTIPNGGAALDTKYDYSIYSLGTDGQNVYGTMGPANFEGTFKASWADGTLGWIADCHGDTYSVQPVGDVVYTASHAHDCGNARSFEDYLPPYKWYRALALTTATTQTTRAEDGNYKNYAGQPSPTVLDWYPAFNTGTKTGTSQGPWDVTAAQGYVLYGGEFTQVNEKGQQGLVRFALPDKAPNKIAPSLAGADMKPTVTDFGGTHAKLSWPTNYDWDNANLTYQVIRNGDTSKPVFETTQPSRFWQRGTLNGNDGPLTPGTTYSYQIRTVDPFGNATLSDAVTYKVPAESAGQLTSYDRSVIADKPSLYLPMNEPTGTTAVDQVGTNSARVIQARGDGIESDARGRAYQLNGTNQWAATYEVTPPQVYSTELWFKTTSKKGGALMAMAGARSITPPGHDRHLYMDTNGWIWAANYDGSVKAVSKQKAFNDGGWHHVVTSLGPNGLSLYVDGELMGTRADTTKAHAYAGGKAYWTIGAQALNKRPNAPANIYFEGAIDNVATYARVLDPTTIKAHYQAGATTIAPLTSYDRSILADQPSLYLPMNESTGTTAVDWVGTGSAATIQSRGDGIEADSQGRAYQLNGTNQWAATQAVTSPQVYSTELWFKTTSKMGGALMAMAGDQTVAPPGHDRHLYMDTNGWIWAANYDGSVKAVSKQKAFNDGGWHHVVTSLGPNGLSLYVDGELMGTRADTTTSHAYAGGKAYWTIGAQALNKRPNAPANIYFAGAIDNVATYARVLDLTTIKAHYQAGITAP